MATLIVRAGGPTPLADDLGLLSKFPGRWRGKGFNLIARPAKQGVSTNPVFFLQLNATMETLDFAFIGGDIPNRGFVEEDAQLHAVRYTQDVTDLVSSTAIHFEPGFWLHVPQTKEGGETYVRQAAIPHGDSLIAQSTFFTTVNGGPDLKTVNSFPFPDSDPIPDLNADPANPIGGSYIDPYTNPGADPARGNKFPGQFFPGLNAAAVVKDPTETLRTAVSHQTIVSTDVIQISTAARNATGNVVGGIVNIPFVVSNADALQMDAIFWIEKVSTDPLINQGSTAPKAEFFQLQYVQRVILNFDGVRWPHVSVATLIKE